MWQILALIVAALLLGLVLGRATSGASSAAPRTATTVRFTTTSTVGHTAEPVPASAITPTTSPGKSLTASGSGDNLSKPFSFAANWQLAWTFTCSQGAGSPFQLVVLDSGQHPVTPSQKISTVGRSGSGTRLYAPGAMLSLQITTPCGWTVRLSGQSG